MCFLKQWLPNRSRKLKTRRRKRTKAKKKPSECPDERETELVRLSL